MRWTRRKGPAPYEGPKQSDEQIAAAMKKFADIFVAGLRDLGREFHADDPDAIRSLDRVVDEFLAAQPREDIRTSVCTTMGAFLGELIVRDAGGTWTFVDGMPGVRFADGFTCFPVNKTQKRFFVGPEHRLELFYDAMVTGARPPTRGQLDADPDS